MEYVGSIPFHNLGGVHYAWFWLDNEWHEWNHGHLAAYFSYETKQVPVPQSPDYGGYPPEEGDPNAGSSGFHVYGIDWYDDRMEFFVDDHVYHIHYLNDGGAYEEDGEDEKTIMDIDGRRVGVSEYSNHFEEWYPFEHRMFAILSAGVGGSQYTYGGAIVPEADFPCSVFIDWVKVFELETTSTGRVDDLQRISVFPNPTDAILHVSTGLQGTWHFEILDVGGKVVLRESATGELEVDVSDLPSGTYVIRAYTKTLSLTKKIFIN